MPTRKIPRNVPLCVLPHVPPILEVHEIIFLSGSKHIMGAFLGIFRGGRDLFDPSKISQKSPILRFAHEKKIISLTFRISITLIVIQDSSSIFSLNMNSRSGVYANTFKKGQLLPVEIFQPGISYLFARNKTVIASGYKYFILRAVS
jgi:hypothetical protein